MVVNWGFVCFFLDEYHEFLPETVFENSASGFLAH